MPKAEGIRRAWYRRYLVPKMPGTEGASCRRSEGAEGTRCAEGDRCTEGTVRRITASSSLEIPDALRHPEAVLPRPKRNVLARCRGPVEKQSTILGADRKSVV